ncbi:MAG: EAL domain-containing protein [Proteobacteria bacterium]|nr:EAL domain-containing protein [Pseudomonadota bacterium]NOG60009.1 EAL domain-containing protein [Pseudomonadota bacterium]
MQPSDFQIFADALPEALILLSGDGSVLSTNKCAKRFLSNRFNSIEQLKSLNDLVNNDPEEIKKSLRAWSRSRTPIPAVISWKSEKEFVDSNWRCQAFMIEPAVKNNPAQLIIRCIPGRGQLSEFTLLNAELEKTQNTLKTLLNTREALEKEHELATVTLKCIGDAVITTDNIGNIESLNPVAEALTGWTNKEALGKPSCEIFNIISEITREPSPDPIQRSLKENIIIELGNHTILISKDGTEYVIEDSVAPIRNKNHEIIGTVLVFHDVTAKRLALRQLEYLALHDTLTGLNNRHYFEQELFKAVDLAKRGTLVFALLYIDLDEFKAVNDTAGHSVGDNLLTEVSQLFSSRLRRGDTLARLGGDEFGVLLQNINKEQIEKTAESYKQALNDFQFTWKDKMFDINSSIGVTIIDNNINTAAEALRQADVACYVAKQKGRNRLHIYAPKDDRKAMQLGEVSLISKLNNALKNDSFILYFQPIIDSKNIKTNYFEVLLRLKDDDSIITPNIFIPVAERYAIMPKIDKWVVVQVIKLLEQKQYANCKFSINLSGASFEDEDIITFLSKKIKNNTALSESISFEVTETAAVTHIEGTADFMHSLLPYGVKFALDDFGTGFSSFAYLKHLPVDLIKIDGVFVKDIAHDPADQAMVRSINNIAHSLNKKTIAEYVENEEILDILKDIGIDYFQGYHLGKPDTLDKHLVFEEVKLA